MPTRVMMSRRRTPPVSHLVTCNETSTSNRMLFAPGPDHDTRQYLGVEGKEWRAQLRGATYRGDGAAVVALFPDGVSVTALQRGGDGLLSALAQDIDGARELAERCAADLRERSWEGDDELADQLDAALGTRPTSMLRPLAVSLEDLNMILEGDPVHGGGAIELDTGVVWPEPAIEYAVETGELDEDATDDRDKWLFVECAGSRDGYRDMEWFIGSVRDPALARRLDRAIEGRGAFRRFRDALSERPVELDEWFAFSEERQLGRARAWLAFAGYRPLPRAPRD